MAIVKSVGRQQPSAQGMTDPTPNMDISAGWAVGDTYVNVDTSAVFVCRSSAIGAARWQKQARSTFGGYVSGGWYSTFEGNANAGGSGIASLSFAPCIIKETVTITALGVRVSAASSGGMFMLGLYKNDPATARPSGVPVIAVTGGSTANSTVVSFTLAQPVTLEPGTYWLGAQADNSTARFVAASFGSLYVAANAGGNSLSSVLLSNTGYNLTYILSGNTYGSFPDITGAVFVESGNSSIVPILIIRAA